MHVLVEAVLEIVAENVPDVGANFAPFVVGYALRYAVAWSLEQT